MARWAVTLCASKTSPCKTMEIEAFLPPPRLRPKRIYRSYALRALSFNQSHAIQQRLPDIFTPNPGQYHLRLPKSWLDWERERMILSIEPLSHIALKRELKLNSRRMGERIVFSACTLSSWLTQSGNQILSDYQNWNDQLSNSWSQGMNILNPI